jgi:hypothetical protein
VLEPRVRICILGAGDLGLRLASLLAAHPSAPEVLLAGRGAGLRMQAFAANCRGPGLVRAARVDLLDRAALAAIVDAFLPSVIVQCAALLSPWALLGRSDRAARALQHAGFAAQLCVQLPIVLQLMQALRAQARRVLVVNCSYPDLTHPVLAKLELAPLIGVGNAGMIQAVVSATLRERGADTQVRVCAHHAQVAAVMAADPSRCSVAPRIFLGERGEAADELAFAGVALEAGPALNALSAAHALAVLDALVLQCRPLRTSAPGPLGLPGGYPVRVCERSVALDLPAGLELGAALELQTAAAHMDGVGRVANDGTLELTDAACAELAAIEPALARPLRPHDCLARAALLRRALAL